MHNRSMIWKSLLGMMLTLALISVGHANVWVDENFDGTSQFVQGDGAGSPADATLDTYSTNALASPISSVLTNTGSVAFTKSFDGSFCYELEVGEVLAVGEPFQDQANGNFVVYQFAVNVDPIPASGTVAELRYDCDSDSGTGGAVDFSYYVRLESNGSSVDIIGGEDVANTVASEATIGTLADASDWAFVTCVFQKAPAATADSRAALTGQGSMAQGMHFFVDSTTESANITIPAPENTVPAFVSRGWDWSVSSGTVYLDNIYWDGGLEDDDTNSNLEALDTAPSPTSVNEWELLN